MRQADGTNKLASASQGSTRGGKGSGGGKGIGKGKGKGNSKRSKVRNCTKYVRAAIQCAIRLYTLCLCTLWFSCDVDARQLPLPAECTVDCQPADMLSDRQKRAMIDVFETDGVHD